ncbi:MAG: hypothetical protein DRH26_17860 [Deltaproteobacteria bacterium]|nr:MAG: hypothetical protein DRH26_17860 [Deltaproteobacteria bacterium]
MLKEKKGIDILQKILQEKIDEKRRKDMARKKTKIRQTENGDEKWCPKCQAYHPMNLEYFYKDGTSSTGFSSWCRGLWKKSEKRDEKKKQAKTVNAKTTAESAAVKTDNSDKRDKEVITDDSKQKFRDRLKTVLSQRKSECSSNPNKLTLDFTEHEDLLCNVKAAADDQFRTPAMQVLWLLATHSELEVDI